MRVVKYCNALNFVLQRRSASVGLSTTKGWPASKVVGGEVREAHHAQNLGRHQEGGGDGALQEVPHGSFLVHAGCHCRVGVRAHLKGRGRRRRNKREREVRTISQVLRQWKLRKASRHEHETDARSTAHSKP